MLAPDPAPGAGDDRDPSVQCAHCRELPRRSSIRPGRLVAAWFAVPFSACRTSRPSTGARSSTTIRATGERSCCSTVSSATSTSTGCAPGSSTCCSTRATGSSRSTPAGTASPTSRTSSRAYEDDALTKDAQALLDQLGLDQYVLVGFSMGARTALHVAADRPARPRRRRARARRAQLGETDARDERGARRDAHRRPRLDRAATSCGHFREMADAIHADREALAALMAARAHRGARHRRRREGSRARDRDRRPTTSPRAIPAPLADGSPTPRRVQTAGDHAGVKDQPDARTRRSSSSSRRSTVHEPDWRAGDGGLQRSGGRSSRRGRSGASTASTVEKARHAQSTRVAHTERPTSSRRMVDGSAARQRCRSPLMQAPWQARARGRGRSVRTAARDPDILNELVEAADHAASDARSQVTSSTAGTSARCMSTQPS